MSSPEYKFQINQKVVYPSQGVGKITDITKKKFKEQMLTYYVIYLAVSDSLVTNGYSNKDFIYSIFDEFYGAENMPYGCNFVVYSSQTLENLTMGAARLYTILVMAIPAAIAIVGAVVIVRRKNR